MEPPASANLIQSNGLAFPDDPEIVTDRLRTLLRRGNYENSEAKALPFFIEEGCSVVELGAGIGYISTIASVNFGAGSVTCIEANPRLCTYIRDVHDLNGVTNSTVVNAVAMPAPQVAQHGPTIPFYVAKPFWSSSLSPPKKLESARIDVPVQALDEILVNAEADALICDIEGGEATLFDDLDLGPVRHVLVELHTNRIKPHGVVRLFENMHRHGFFYHQQASGKGNVLFKRYRAARSK